MRHIVHEEIKIDNTPMIDVVFLLLIFFMLMETPEADWLLKSDLPLVGGGPGEPNNDPLYINFHLTSEIKSKNELMTFVYLNQSLVAQFSSPTHERLDEIDRLPALERNQIILSEKRKDELQFNHGQSGQIHSIIQKMKHIALGYKKENIKVSIDAGKNVPYKAMLAILNLCIGNDFKQTTFVSPQSSMYRAE